MGGKIAATTVVALLASSCFNVPVPPGHSVCGVTLADVAKDGTMVRRYSNTIIVPYLDTYVLSQVASYFELTRLSSIGA